MYVISHFTRNKTVNISSGTDQALLTKMYKIDKLHTIDF